MYRKSKQRDGILELLSKKNYHPTAEDIYINMKNKFPGIGIATIYRNIDQLVQMGKIIRIDIPGESACFDGNVEKHYHIRCSKCGKIEDVWIDLDLEKQINLKKAIPEFTVLEYKIEFYGICRNCEKIKN